MRINAEDPVRFLPGPGTITDWQQPKGNRIRVDAGYQAGDTVPPLYDSLMAKLIVHADTRDDAIELGRSALSEFRVSGPKDDRRPSLLLSAKRHAVTRYINKAGAAAGLPHIGGLSAITRPSASRWPAPWSPAPRSSSPTSRPAVTPPAPRAYSLLPRPSRGRESMSADCLPAIPDPQPGAQQHLHGHARHPNRIGGPACTAQFRRSGRVLGGPCSGRSPRIVRDIEDCSAWGAVEGSLARLKASRAWRVSPVRCSQAGMPTCWKAW